MKAILVIRRFDEFSRILSENNFQVINLPLIETTPLEDLSEFEKKLDALDEYDGIFITSSAAAKIFAEELAKRNTDYKGKIYVVGGKSFEILRKLNFDLIYKNEVNTAAELLEMIPQENLSGKRNLFIRGERSLNIVPDFLANFGEVDETIVYRNKEIALKTDKIKAIREKFKNVRIEFVCFFSPSAGESFIKQLGKEILHQTRIAAIGKTTAEYFQKQNLSVDFVSPKTAAQTFAESLCEHLKKHEFDARKIGGAT